MKKSNQRGQSQELLALFVLVLILICINIVVGAETTTDFNGTFSALLKGPFYPSDSVSVILWEVRLPRTLAACFCGILLGTVGSVYQSIFRNVLAEPYLVGVSGGAALGGSLAISFGVVGAFGFGILGCAVLGGILALMLALNMSKVRGQLDSQKLLISGLVIGAILSSGMTLVLSSAGQDTNKIMRWLFGSLTPMFWPSVIVLFVFSLISVGIAQFHSQALNALKISRAQAYSVGFEPDIVIKQALIVGAICSSVAVGAIGMVGFLGLIAPNIARSLSRSDHAKTTLFSGLIGAILLLVADLISQRTGELPIGAITAVFGGVGLLVMQRRKSG